MRLLATSNISEILALTSLQLCCLVTAKSNRYYTNKVIKMKIQVPAFQP